MLNRRNFFAAAAACLLTKKMPAWSQPKPKPLPVGYIWAPYIVKYRIPILNGMPTITREDFLEQRGLMARYANAVMIPREYFQEAKVTTG